MHFHIVLDVAFTRYKLIELSISGTYSSLRFHQQYCSAKVALVKIAFIYYKILWFRGGHTRPLPPPPLAHFLKGFIFCFYFRWLHSDTAILRNLIPNFVFSSPHLFLLQLPSLPFAPLARQIIIETRNSSSKRFSVEDDTLDNASMIQLAPVVFSTASTSCTSVAWS